MGKVIEERAVKAVQWLAGRGGKGAPGELGAELGVNHARQAEVSREVERLGWVTRAGGRGGGDLVLTLAGWRAAAPADPVGAGDVVGQVLDGVWPSWAEPHAAFTRLLLAATIARHHLWAAGREDGHLSFAAFGQPGGGKSTHGVLVCHLLGLDWREHTVHLDEQTDGSMRGRRERGENGWQAVASELAGLPFVLFDEADKAPRESRAAVWRYLRGQGRVRVEGAGLQAIRPTSLVAGNREYGDDPWGMLPPGSQRRVALLSTTYLDLARTRELGDHLRTVLRPGLDPACRLDLARLSLPATTLDPAADKVLRSVQGLATDQMGALPLDGLEMAALGRLALRGDGEHLAAAVATAIDYLAVMSTTPGLIRPDWPAGLRAVRAWAEDGGRGDVLTALDRVSEAQGEVKARAAAQLVAGRAEAQQLVGDRARLCELLDLTRASVDGRQSKSWPALARVEGKGLHAELTKLREDAAATRSRAALDEVAALAQETIRRADSLRSEVDEARQRAELEQSQQRLAIESGKRQQAEQDRATREAERRQRQAQREQAKTALAQLMPWVEWAERLWDRDGLAAGATTPLQEFTRQEVPDGSGKPFVSFYVEARADPTGALATFVRVLSDSSAGGPPGEWWTWDGRRVGRGTQTHCPRLASWGDVSRSVIEPLLREWRQREDALRQAAGIRTRTRAWQAA